MGLFSNLADHNPSFAGHDRGLVHVRGGEQEFGGLVIRTVLAFDVKLGQWALRPEGAGRSLGAANGRIVV
jgi:hypothetical protein